MKRTKNLCIICDFQLTKTENEQIPFLFKLKTIASYLTFQKKCQKHNMFVIEVFI